MKYRLLLAGITCLALIAGCKKNTPDAEPLAGPAIPAHFPQPFYTAANNAYTKEAVELGRHLFYERGLSKTGEVSCADCHALVHGFADHNMPVSTGIYGRRGKRNSPALSNLIWNPTFMWDGGITHIEVMPLAPLRDTVEMGANLDSVISWLNRSDKYTNMFQKAFQSRPTEQLMLKSMAQFMATMVSANSPYDKYISGKGSLTERELKGYSLFQANCATCHKEPLMTDYSFRNTGLDASPIDTGRLRITRNEADRGKFRVPSLRNIAVTYPYMHDGRFYTLDEVLNHYNGKAHHNANTDNAVFSIQLSEQDKADIIAFLKTLTDYEFLSNHQLGKP